MAKQHKQGAKAGNSSRRARASRKHVVLRQPEGTYNPDAPYSGWKGADEADLAAQRAQAVTLTQDAVRLAVSRLVRLAATWEATNEFARASKHVRDHSVKCLTDVVSLLDRHERQLPIAHVDAFRITPEDANLLLVHHSVVATLREYKQGHVQEARAIEWLSWLLGNTYRVSKQRVEATWRRLSSSTTKNWVREYGSDVEAAKTFLERAMPGASGRRIAALRKLTRQVEPGPRFSSHVRDLFERLEKKAIGGALLAANADRYVRTLFSL